MRRSLLLLFTLLFVMTVGQRKLHATWKILDPRTISSIDFMPTGIGLVGVGGAGPHLEKWDSKGENGVYIAQNTITTILIVDSLHAWLTVKGDALYYSRDGWNTWSKVISGQNLLLLYASGSTVAVTDGKRLRISTDNVNFAPAHGIDAADSTLALDALDPSTLVAVTGSTIYRSGDGGANWTKTGSTNNSASVFVDMGNGHVYVGGDTIRYSVDRGVTWIPDTTQIFDMTGQVVGAHDCSGVFYITPNRFRGELLRTTSHGVNFQNVGPANLASITYQRGVVADRGSLFYWLDQSGVLSGSVDGVDSAITRSVARYLTAKVDSGFSANACTGAPVPFTITFSYGLCSSVVIDTIRQISGHGLVTIAHPNLSVGGNGTGSVVMSYRASQPGPDTVVLTVHYVSREGNLVFTVPDQFTCRAIAVGTSDPAKLALSTPSIAFGNLKPGGSKSNSFVIKNSGCTDLRVDSIVSSYPEVFAIDSHTFPLTVHHGDSVKVIVTFKPAVIGEYLEAIEIGTSAGHDFVELRGTAGAPSAVPYLNAVSHLEIYPNPADRIMTVLGAFSPGDELRVYDLLGRTVATHRIEGERSSASLDIRSLPAGRYLLRRSNRETLPFLVQH